MHEFFAGWSPVEEIVNMKCMSFFAGWSPVEDAFDMKCMIFLFLRGGLLWGEFLKM